MPEIIVIEPTQNPCTRPKRIAAYCRVSSDSEDQLHSYYAQVRYYTDQLAQMKDVVSAGIYADEGITGTEMRKRSEFLRLIEDCRRGKIDRIVTKSISRFARNTLESLETARTLKALGVSIYFEEDHLDTESAAADCAEEGKNRRRQQAHPLPAPQFQGGTCRRGVVPIALWNVWSLSLP